MSCCGSPKRGRVGYGARRVCALPSGVGIWQLAGSGPLSRTAQRSTAEAGADADSHHEKAIVAGESLGQATQEQQSRKGDCYPGFLLVII